MVNISVSERKIEKQKGVVILPLKEYQKLCEKAVPTYCLEGGEAKELDKLVKEGLKDYKEGRTIKASSLKEAMEIYGRKKNQKN